MSFESYSEAQSAVDRLAHADFPVTQVSIVGTDLTSVERVTGKMSYARAAGAGALSGVWFGAFLGLVMFLFSPATDFSLLGAAIALGAGFGMLFGIVSYSLTRRRRDFTSVMQVVATRYALIVEPSLSLRARTILGINTAQPDPSAIASTPSEGPAT